MNSPARLKARLRGLAAGVAFLAAFALAAADTTAKNQYPTFFKAIKGGDLATAKQFLAVGLPPDLEDEEGLSALTLAVMYGRLEIARALIQRGAKVDKSDKYGNTPLIFAAYLGNIPITDLLVKSGANVNAINIYGDSPLLKSDRPAITAKLVNAGGRPALENKSGLSPLLRCVQKGQTDSVKLLLDKGANLEADDERGRAPLAIAAMAGHLDTLELLLERGAKLEALDKDGRSPLALAAMEGKERTLRRLVAQGADLNRFDLKHETPYSLALHKGHARCAKLLEQLCPRLEAVSLHYAKRDHQDIPSHKLAELAANLALMKDYDKALSFSGNPEALKAVALACLQNGKPGMVEDDLLPLFKKDQNSLLQQNYVLAALAEHYFAADKFQKGEQALDKLGDTVFPQRQNAEAAEIFHLRKAGKTADSDKLLSKALGKYSGDGWAGKLKDHFLMKTLELRAADHQYAGLSALSASELFTMVTSGKRAEAAGRAAAALIRHSFDKSRDAPAPFGPSPEDLFCLPADPAQKRRDADGFLKALSSAFAEVGCFAAATTYAAKIQEQEQAAAAQLSIALAKVKNGDLAAADRCIAAPPPAAGDLAELAAATAAARAAQGDLAAALADIAKFHVRNEADKAFVPLALSQVSLKLWEQGRSDHVPRQTLEKQGFECPDVKAPPPDSDDDEERAD